MLRAFSWLVALLALASSLRAEMLDRRQLPASALWCIHLDVEAANQSILGKGLRATLLAQPAARKAIAKAKEALGIDPVTDIQSLTVYGLSYQPDRAILIVRGKSDKSRLDAFLKKSTGYHTEWVGGHELYLWNESPRTDENNPHHRRRSSAGAFFNESEVVFGPDAQTVAAELDVLDEKSPALSADSPLAAQEPRGAVIWAAAVGLDQARNLPLQSPLLRQCESGTLAVGEYDGNAFLQAHISARSADIAQQLRSLLEGARAMALLQAGDHDGLAQLANYLKVTADDRMVNVSWTYASAELLKIVLEPSGLFAATTQPGKEP